MHRRDFLHPRHLAETAGHVLGAVEEIGAALAVAEPADATLLRLAWRAMATTFEIVLPYGNPNSLSVAEAAFGLLDELEAQLSVYREQSEVSQLNKAHGKLQAHGKLSVGLAGVCIEEGLFALLQTAARIHAETDGAFDVTAGALLKAWGFFKGPRRVPTEGERAEALRRVGMRHVELNADERTVRYRRPVEINLGSIGKGYALDRMASLLRGRGNLPSFLLQGGTSSVYARGTAPGEARGWQVAIRHPWDGDRHLATVWLRDRALGTSAATWQHLEYNGRKLGHVLDPRTGWPASGIASASVLAPTGAEADALSTAFFVGGIELARRYCDTHPGVGAVLLRDGERVPTVLGLAPEACSLPAC